MIKYIHNYDIKIENTDTEIWKSISKMTIIFEPVKLRISVINLLMFFDRKNRLRTIFFGKEYFISQKFLTALS